MSDGTVEDVPYDRNRSDTQRDGSHEARVVIDDVPLVFSGDVKDDALIVKRVFTEDESIAHRPGPQTTISIKDGKLDPTDPNYRNVADPILKSVKEGRQQEPIEQQRRDKLADAQAVVREIPQTLDKAKDALDTIQSSAGWTAAGLVAGAAALVGTTIYAPISRTFKWVTGIGAGLVGIAAAVAGAGYYAVRTASPHVKEGFDRVSDRIRKDWEFRDQLATTLAEPTPANKEHFKSLLKEAARLDSSRLQSGGLDIEFDVDGGHRPSVTTPAVPNPILEIQRP